WAGDRDVGPDRRRQRLFDERRLTRTGLERRVAHRALLDARHAGRDADHDVRLEDPNPRDLVDHVAQHRLGDQVVGDDAVSHGTDGAHVARGAADHLASLFTNRNETVVVVADGNDGGLVEYHTLALDVDQDIGGPEVDANFHDALRGACCVLERRPRRSQSGPAGRPQYTGPGGRHSLPETACRRVPSAPMPEGDTLFRVATWLRRLLLGQTLVEARARPGPLLRSVPDLSGLAGLRITEVESRGKHLLITFGEGRRRRILRNHLRMSGSWHRYRPGEAWRLADRRATLVLRTDHAVAVCFDCPTVELLTDVGAARSKALARLGPDLLGPDFDAADAVANLRKLPHTAIGQALLD